MAHRIGWSPDAFWRATGFEFETQMHEAIAMSQPPKPKPIPTAMLVDFLKSKAA